MKLTKRNQQHHQRKQCFSTRPIIIQETYDLNKLRTINLNTINDRVQTLMRLIEEQTRRNSDYGKKQLRNYSDIDNSNFSSANSSRSNISISVSSISSTSNRKVIITEKINNQSIPIQKDSSSQTEFSSSSDFEAEEVDRVEDVYEELDKHHELTEDDLEFLLANTSFRPEQIQKWHLDFMRKCPNGFISFNQFKSSYKYLVSFDLNEKSKKDLITRLFNLFDIDGDGQLNFSEFLISFWIRCKAPLREKFTWIFNMFDLDRNGSLNYIEMRNALNMCLNVDDLDELLEILNDDNKKMRSSIISLSTSLSCSPNDSNEIYSVNNDNNEKSSSSSSSSSSFNQINIFNNFTKKYDLFSKTAKLIEDKLNQTIYLLDLMVKNKKVSHHNQSEIIYSKLNSSSEASSSSSFNLNSDSNYEIIDSCRMMLYSRVDSVTQLVNMENDLKRVQISREDFLDLCENYKLFRKLILPIKNFYD